MLIPVTNFDIVFISYDEPDADRSYDLLETFSFMIGGKKPLRVHGVKGFDAAHKAAANLATTDRFITVDGDNQVWPEFFGMRINDEEPADVVYSFTAVNTLNGLAYGNGGVKVWPRQLVLSVNTHENGEGNDFCSIYRYWQRNETVSSVILGSPYHAYRAGYREAVKLSLIDGKRLDSWRETERLMYPPNLSRLLTWCTVGRDDPFGIWAIYGARQGLFDLGSRQINPDDIRDYDWFDALWETQQHSDPETRAQELNMELLRLIGYKFPELDHRTSQWIKLLMKNGINPERHGLMFPDMKAPNLKDVE